MVLVRARALRPGDRWLSPTGHHWKVTSYPEPAETYKPGFVRVTLEQGQAMWVKAFPGDLELDVERSEAA